MQNSKQAREMLKKKTFVSSNKRKKRSIQTLSGLVKPSTYLVPLTNIYLLVNILIKLILGFYKDDWDLSVWIPFILKVEA